MIQLEKPSHQKELRNSIKTLVNALDTFTKVHNYPLAETRESVASYVCRINEQSLNRSFLDYCSASRYYAKVNCY